MPKMFSLVVVVVKTCHMMAVVVIVMGMIRIQSS